MNGVHTVFRHTDYGYSASQTDTDTLQSFSKEMQMPCLIITKNTFTLLLQNMTDITEQIDSHVRIRMSEKTAMDAYRAWVKTLKGKIPEVYKL